MFEWFSRRKERQRAAVQQQLSGAELALVYKALGGEVEPADVERALTIVESAERHGIPSAVLEKALSLRASGKLTPQARDLDPYDVMQAGDEALTGDQHLGTAGLSYDTLQKMARTSTVAAIITTRVTQVAEFAWPAGEDDSLGFKIRLRDREKKASRAEQKRARQIAEWMVACGDERLGYDLNLESFLRQFVRDSLIYDQGCFEVVRTRGKEIAGFQPVDARTIRRAIPSAAEYDKGIRDRDATAFVQVVRDEVVAEWSAKDLAFCVRRPRTDIAVRGYGYPELEDLIRVVTGILHGEAYNAGNFTHGLHAAGVLALKSKMGAPLFRAFRRDFYAMMSGAHNARKTPIIQLDPDAKEELQSINLSQTNREMEFKEWMAHLQKQACAMFQMDAAELGIVYGVENQGGGGLNSTDALSRITASKERGLRPLLRAVGVWLNRHVVSQVDPDYELVWVGLDAAERAARLEADLKRLQNFMTVNEIRKLHDLPPIAPEVDGGAADLVLNATYQGTAMQMKQIAEQARGEEAGDEETGEEEPEEEPEPTLNKGTTPLRRVTVEVV